MASITENLIQDVQIGQQSPSRIAASAYGVCDTPASTADKVVDMTGFTLMQGVTINIKFTYANTASGVRLQVETSGLHPVIVYGGNNAPIPKWEAGAVVAFTYDGSNWVMNTGLNTDTTYNIQNTYSNTSEDPISGKGVKNALETLDIATINNTAGKTVATITEQDGLIDATFQDIQITENQVVNPLDNTKTLADDLATKAPINSPTFTGTVTLPAAGPQSDNEAATKAYVDSATAGITGVMRYIDAPNIVFSITYPTPTEQNSDPMPIVTTSGTFPTGYTARSGDVIIYNHQEFVYTGSVWRLLGDEGSYAFKTNTAQVVEDITLSNSLPSITITPTSIPNVTNAGSAPIMQKTNHTIKTTNVSSVTPTDVKVENGTLKITIGSGANFTDVTATEITSWTDGVAPTLGTAISVGSASNWQQGTGASIATKPLKTVVIP